MRLKTLRMWKLFKPAVFLLTGWAVFSALMLCLFASHLFDFRGGLPEADIAASQSVDKEHTKAVKTIELFAEGASVEVASA